MIEKNACLMARGLYLGMHSPSSNSMRACEKGILTSKPQTLVYDLYVNSGISMPLDPAYKTKICNDGIGLPLKTATDAEAEERKKAYAVVDYNPAVYLYYRKRADIQSSGGTIIKVAIPPEPWILELEHHVIASEQQLYRSNLLESGFISCGKTSEYAPEAGCYCK